MIRYIKFIAIIAVVLLSTTTRAEERSRFSFVYQLNGNSSTKTDAGSIVGSISEDGKTATLTINPAEGNYITADNITVIKTISGNQAQTRTGLADKLKITPTNADADPSGETSYTFAVEDANYDYEVTADFQSRTSISDATVTLAATSYTYDGKEHKPTVSSVKLGETALDTNDYTVSYADDCTNVSTITVTITGTRTYTGTATATYSITEATMTATATGFNGTYDGKAHGITVTAPEGAEVMFGYTKETYDKLESPAYSNAGTYWIHYQVTQANYTTISDSAKVDITKATINPIVTMESWTEGKQTPTPNVTGNDGNGEVYFTFTNEDSGESTEETPTTPGKYTVKVTIAESTNYLGGEATAEFEIYAKPNETIYYDLWIGGRQVTSENANDILENAEKDDKGKITKTASYIYNPDNHTLIITNDDSEKNIETSIPKLKVFISGNNKIKNIDGNKNIDCELIFTTDDTKPGSLTVKKANGTVLLNSFKTITYEYSLQLIEKEQETDFATISVLLPPKTDEETVTLDQDALAQRDEEGNIVTDEDGNPVEADMSNLNYNNVLVTIDNKNTDGEGIVKNENNESAIGLVNIMTDEKVNEVAQKVENGEMTPGSQEYADNTNAVTVITAPGEGDIELDVDMNEEIDEDTGEGTELAIKHGTDETIGLSDESALNAMEQTAIDFGIMPTVEDEDGNETTGELDENLSASEKAAVISKAFSDIKKAIEVNRTSPTTSAGKAIKIVSLKKEIHHKNITKASYIKSINYPLSKVIKKNNTRKKVIVHYNGNLTKTAMVHLKKVAKRAGLKVVFKARPVGADTRLGKRGRAHGTIYSVKVSPSKLASNNSAAMASGGIIPSNAVSSEDDPTEILGVKEFIVSDNRWFTIDGRQIDKPTQKGLYIHNRKKVVVK